MGFDGMGKIVGVVYPVPKKLVGRLLYGNRNVFVKYLARNTSLRIAPRHKVVFYASHDAKELVGEGTIQTIDFLTPFGALEKYGDKIFLDRDELVKYATKERGRALTKRMLVLVLSKIKTYLPPPKWGRPITMTGQYLTDEEYKQLVHKWQLSG